MSKRRNRRVHARVYIWAWVIRAYEASQVAWTPELGFLAYPTLGDAERARPAAQAIAHATGYRVRLLMFREAETLETLQP